MVRKRGKAKRSSKRRRIKRYSKKVSSVVTTLAFKQRLDPMALDLKYWLIILDELEKRVTQICLAQGIPTTDLPKYFAYAKEQFKHLDRFSALSLWFKLQETLAEYVVRGIKETKAMEILGILEQLIQDKRIFFKTGQPQLIDDYLRFKMFAYVISPIPFLSELKPIKPLLFSHQIRPLAYRTFGLRPYIITSLIKYVLPTSLREFSLDLRNKITTQLLYELTIYYSRIFSLHPATAIKFLAYVSAYQYFETELKPKVSLEFYQYLTPLTYRLIQIERFLNLFLTTQVTPLPLRIFSIRPITRFLFNAQHLTTNLMLKELRPKPYLVFSAQPLTTQLAKNELRPKVSLEFSYYISSA